MGRVSVAIVAASLLGLAAPAAHAEDDWHLQLEGLTDFPLHVGGQVTLELPLRFRLSASVGGMPGAYVDTFNAVAVAAGGYDDAEAALVRSALQDSLVVRLHAGWRPLPNEGFYVEAGYGLAALGGGVRTAELAEAVTGEVLPLDQALSADKSGFVIETELHMLDVELGWIFPLGGGWTLRAAVGWALTMEASARVEPRFEPLLPTVIDDFTLAAEQRLERIFLAYVHPPTLSLAFGYLFM